MDTGDRTTQDLLNINEEYTPPSSSQSGSSHDDPRRCSTCGGDGEK